MKLVLVPLRFAYTISRRLGIIDVTWLMHMPTAPSGEELAVDGYEFRVVSTGELSELRRAGLVHSQVGVIRDDSQHESQRFLVGAFSGSQLVSFAWFAERTVPGRENFSRSMHLGTSVELPAGSAFVYNAWTDPEHRGKRLMAALMHWAIRNRVAGGRSLSTMIDWTNQPSCRAFEKLGMRRLGLIARVGCGRFQVSVVPHAARHQGLLLAGDAPGLKVAV